MLMFYLAHFNRDQSQVNIMAASQMSNWYKAAVENIRILWAESLPPK